jgi:hypothetical protein
MKEIVNSIFNYETCNKNGFFNKKLMNKKMEKRINQIRDLFQRWFSSEFEYNYNIKNNSIFDFYILYNNKLYRYFIIFEDKEFKHISLDEKYIISNPPYYIKILYPDYNQFGSMDLDILKYIPDNKKSPIDYYNPKPILTKVYDRNKILCNYSNHNCKKYISITIKNNNIKEVYYIDPKYCEKGHLKYKYIYNNECVYHYKKKYIYYAQKFCGTYRFVKLFI